MTIFLIYDRLTCLCRAPEGIQMDKAFKEKMRKSLASLKEQILKQLALENSEFQELIEDMKPKDLADIASDDIDRRILESLGSQEMRRLQWIESALGRVRDGHYGVCMSCGKKIPRERLEAIPYALLCIDCKSSDERRNR